LYHFCRAPPIPVRNALNYSCSIVYNQKFTHELPAAISWTLALLYTRQSVFPGVFSRHLCRSQIIPIALHMSRIPSLRNRTTKCIELDHVPRSFSRISKCISQVYNVAHLAFFVTYLSALSLVNGPSDRYPHRCLIDRLLCPLLICLTSKGASVQATRGLTRDVEIHGNAFILL